MSRLTASRNNSNASRKDSNASRKNLNASRKNLNASRKDLNASRKDLNASRKDLIEVAPTTDIINQLLGDNLLQVDPETNFYKSWPIGKEWQTVENLSTAGLGRLLPREERQAIEQELESIEAKFKDCLQEIEPTKFQSSPQPLSSLLKRIKELQERICNSERGLNYTNPFEQELEGIEAKFNDYSQGTSKLQIAANSSLSFPLSLLLKRVKELEARIYNPQGELHLTYPFFLPVFTLHLALIQANVKSIEDGQESLDRLVFDAISYLRNVMDSAYRERSEDIVLKRGGARNELGYVEDTRSNRSLTEWVSYAENEESLKAQRKHLSTKLALKYVEGINFSLAWSVLDEFVKLLPTNDGETQVFSIRKSAEAKIAQWKQVSETTAKAETINTRLLTPTAYDESIIPQDPEAMDYVKEYYKTVAIAMIGDLPIPGAATLSAVTGLFVGWIFGDEDKWKMYAQAIADYIAEEISGLETTQIENDLITAEEEFDDLCRFLDETEWEFGQQLSDDPHTCGILESRFVTLLYNLNELRQALYNPYSPAYTTFPYFDRLFTLHGAVLGTATTTLTTYNTYNEFREHFEKSRDYLDRATSSAVNYRRNAIDDKWSGASNNSRFYDKQSLSYFSDKRPLKGNDSRWHGFQALTQWLSVTLGYVYPNRLKILAGIHNFDKMVDQYNDFWSSRKNDHIAIEPLWDEWSSEVEAQRDSANGGREKIKSGYSSWDNGPGVHDHLYFEEGAYPSHYYGPRIYKDGGSDYTYLPLTDYPRIQDVIPLEKFDRLDISPAYNVIVYSEENFEGDSHTFSASGGKFTYPKLSGCGFEIKSLKIIYIKSH